MLSEQVTPRGSGDGATRGGGGLGSRSTVAARTGAQRKTTVRTARVGRVGVPELTSC